VTGRCRRIALLASVLPLVAGLSACSDEAGARRELQAALDTTRLLPHRFVYTVSTPDQGSFQVQGLVEDDFRYKARLLRGSTPVFDEVVNDDAIAVRFADPDLIGAYIDDAQREVAELDTNLTGVTVVQALQAKRWVLDPAGAPSLTDQTRAARNQGKDPVFDALGIYAYVEQAMAEAFDVQEWSEDDLSPAYRSSEDVFPRPSESSGVSRYDLVRPFLPPIGATGAASDDLPAAKHFRKMAVYVQDGRIIRVMERIESTGRAGDDLVGYLRNLGEEVGLPDDVLDEELDALRDMDDKQRSDVLLGLMSEIAESAGAAPIPRRTMTFDLVDTGDDDIEADLPLDVIEGSLAILLNRGAKAEAATASGGPGTSPASQTAQDDGA
jgi:hypothetical protein